MYKKFTLKKGDRIKIGKNVRLTNLGQPKNFPSIGLGIEAPLHIEIMRKELVNRRRFENEPLRKLIDG
jgi:sRNA-binding carbon storage regulator CsrA